MAGKAGAGKYDVIIVGGGPAGLTLGAGLVHFMPELDVAVCERRPFAVPDDARSLALAAGVTRVFEALGVWDAMRGEACPIMKMDITDSGSGDISRPVFLSFEGEVMPGLPFAHMVPFRQIVGALLDKCGQGLDLLSPAGVAAVDTGGPLARLMLEDGKEISAPLVIAADGSRSALRDMVGIETVVHDYRQSGLVSTISHELDHENTAFEHFRPAGPFASLPLPGRRSSLVWTESGAEAQRLLDLDEDEQVRIIEGAMGRRLGAVGLEEPVQAFPLRLCIAREFVRPRFALLGDAAHGIHPITGQGLNLGLKDVAAMIEVIIEAVRHGEDIGSIEVLQRYERWRRLDVSLMAMATDGLNRLFSNDSAVLRTFRDLGLGLVDRMPVVKKALIRHASATGGSGPRLLQGLDV